MAKSFAIVNGKVVRMSDAAFRIAAKHFGALREAPEYKVIPPELLKLPRPIITPEAKPVAVVVPPVVKAAEPVTTPPATPEAKQPVDKGYIVQLPSTAPKPGIVQLPTKKPIVKRTVKRPVKKK